MFSETVCPPERSLYICQDSELGSECGIRLGSLLGTTFVHRPSRNFVAPREGKPDGSCVGHVQSGLGCFCNAFFHSSACMRRRTCAMLGRVWARFSQSFAATLRPYKVFEGALLVFKLVFMGHLCKFLLWPLRYFCKFLLWPLRFLFVFVPCWRPFSAAFFIAARCKESLESE